MPYVFVSYARVRKAYVDGLARQLEARGVPVWQDTEQLRFGELWDARVSDAIRGASLTVLVVSREWYDSVPCQNEAGQARYYKRPILEIPAGSDNQDLAKTADSIAEEYRRVSPISDLTAMVETRADSWLRGRRRRRDLLRGRSLREVTRALRDAGDKRILTENAEKYVRASRARARRERALTVLSALIVLWAFYAYHQVRSVSRESSLVGSRSYANSLIVYSSRLGNRVNPYLVADTTLRILDDEGYARDAALNDGYSTQLMMRSALDAITPTERLSEDEATSRGFSFPDGARTRTTSETSGLTAELSANGARVTLLGADGNDALAVTRLEMPSFDASFSPDGSYLAVLGEGGIAVLDGTRGSQLLFLNGTQNPKGSTLAWSPDSTSVAVHTPDGEVFSWPVRQDTTILASTDRTFVDGVSLGAGERAAFLARDGSITFVDVTLGSVEDVDETLDVAEALCLASGSGEKDFFVIACRRDDPQEPHLLHVDCAAESVTELPLPDDLVPTCVSAIEGGASLAVGCEGALLVLDYSGNVLDRADGIAASAVALDAEGRVFVGARGRGLAVLEPGAAEVSRPVSITARGGTTPRAIAVSTNKVVAVGDGTVRGDGSSTLTHEWSAWVEREGITNSMTTSTSTQSQTIEASPDGKLFACGLSDGTLVTLFSEEGYGTSTRHELGSELRGLAVAPTGDFVIGATEDGRIVRVAIDRSSNNQQALRERLEERVQQGIELGLYHNEASVISGTDS